jgi:hypothetical protein
MRHTLTALSLLLLASSAVAQQGYSAKSLFFGEDDTLISAPTGLTSSPPTRLEKAEPMAKKAAKQVDYKKPAATKQIGVSYFVRLKNADGSSRDVLASRKFKSGERFQLGVKVSSPGYVYVLNQEPDGKIIQIYPQPGRDNFINAMGTIFLPSQGSFEFDNKPGVEQLLVYLSPTQIDDKISDRVRESSPDVISTFVDAAPVPARCAQVHASRTTTPGEWHIVESADEQSQYASKGISFSDDVVPACQSAALTSYDGYASKGISFSDDVEPVNGGQVASYVVKNIGAQTDKSLYLKLKLVHK